MLSFLFPAIIVYHRIVISESTHPYISEALRVGFDGALSQLLETQELDDGSNSPTTMSEVSDSNSAGAGGSSRGARGGKDGRKNRSVTDVVVSGGVCTSVLSLPPPLVELVRKIQHTQAELKSRLHCVSTTA